MKRRSFIQRTGASVLGVSLSRSTSRAAGASDGISVGIIGCKRGRALAEGFKGLGARIAYVCDPDEQRRNDLKKRVGAEQAVADLRHILDDRSVDAVAIAAPDHWHAAAAILACEAGKHVYVEKPCSHNIREGQLMIAAARRTNRVMQVGAQSRSTTALKNGIQQLREGAIGKVLVAKAWNSQKRANIGHASPSDPPPGFDYDLWVGPAPMRPFQSNRHHYTWHWWYDFGTGDMGNDGVHELDLAVWGLDVDRHPTVVTGHGSKLYFDDDQEFPDTQYVTFEFPKTRDKERKILLYEQRIWSPYGQEGIENGNVFYGTEGYMVLSKQDGWKIFGKDGVLLREQSGKFSVAEHAADFFAAIRAGKTPNGDIEIGHKSAVLAHMANIIARTGHPALEFDPEKERFIDNPEANALLSRSYREGHWAVPAGV